MQNEKWGRRKGVRRQSSVGKGRKTENPKRRQHSEVCDKIVDRHSDVFRDLTQEKRRYVAALVVGHSGLTSVVVLELAVRTFLSNKRKTEVPQDPHHLIGLENGDAASHARGSNSHRLGADKLRFQARFAVLKEHRNNLSQIILQFIERLTLRVGPGKTGHKTDEKPGFRTLFNNSGERMHRWIISFTRKVATRGELPGAVVSRQQRRRGERQKTKRPRDERPRDSRAERDRSLVRPKRARSEKA